jgi:Tol biopolymer transport system component
MKKKVIIILFLVASMITVLSNASYGIELVRIENITNTPNPVEEAVPIWSPDGSKIAFTKGCDYTAGGEGTSIWIRNSDGSLIPYNDPVGWANIVPCDWSPDGSKILVMYDYVGGGDIWIGNSDRSGQRQITFESERESWPFWHPSGNRIIFTKGIYIGPSDLWTMNPDGSDQQQLTFGRTDHYGSWSPDGTTVLFVRMHEGYAHLFIRDSNSNESRLTEGNGVIYSYPSWSPDGQYIAFVSTEGGVPWPGDLWVMKTDKTEKTRLTNMGEIYTPRWSPRGDAIAFQRGYGSPCDSDIYVAYLSMTPVLEANLEITNIETSPNPTDGELTTVYITLQNVSDQTFHANQKIDSNGNYYNTLIQLELWDNKDTDDPWISPYCRPTTEENDIKRYVAIPDIQPNGSYTISLTNIVFRVPTTPTDLMVRVLPIEDDGDLTNNSKQIPIYIWPNFIRDGIDCARLWITYLKPHTAPITAKIDLGKIHYTFQITEDTLKAFENAVYIENAVGKLHISIAEQDWANVGIRLARLAVSIAQILQKDPVTLAINIMGTVWDGIWACSNLLAWGMDVYEKARIIIFNYIWELANSFGIVLTGMFTESPVNLLAIDNYGNKSGVAEEGILEEIENSKVFLTDDSQLLIFPKTEFQTKITGKGIGDYKLNVFNPYEDKVLLSTLNELPVVPGMVYLCKYDWVLLNEGEKGVTIEIDYQNDGVIDYVVEEDLSASIHELPKLKNKILRLEIVPRILNCDSKCKWVICLIKLPKGYYPWQIDKSSVLLQDSIKAEWSQTLRGLLISNFDRRYVCDIAPEKGSWTIKVSGLLLDGTPFIGEDTIFIK